MSIKNLIGCALSLALATSALAQLFTYQGELKTGGVNANGSYDFEFRVFDVASAGTQLGITNQFTGLMVNNGKFTATFDAGFGVFNGSQRWLEIRVRPTGSTSFTTLHPRTRITHTPMAIHANSATTAQTSATERWNDLGGGVLTNRPEVNRVFINRTNGIFPDEVFGVSRTTSPGDILGGMYVNTTGADGIPYYGWATSGTSRAEAHYDNTSQVFRLNIMNANRVSVSAAGLVGLGMTPIAGGDRLQVNGAVNATQYKFSTPKTSYVFVPAEDFRSVNLAHGGVITTVQGGAYLDASVGNGMLVAPVHLPHGATITEVRFFVLDNSATANLDLKLTSVNGIVPGQVVHAAISTSITSASIQTLSPASITNPNVDSSIRCFLVSAFCEDWQGPTTVIRGARITYTVPEAQ